MRQRSGYTFSVRLVGLLTICLTSNMLWSQVPPAKTDSTQVDLTIPESDTLIVQVPPAPALVQSLIRTGFEIGVDYLKLPTFFWDEETKYEASFGFIFSTRWIVSIEAGHAAYTSEKAYKNAPDYTVEGDYGRLGLDYRVPITPQANISLGVRYARSAFEDRGTFHITNPLFDDIQQAVVRTGLAASWYEVVIGSERPLGRHFFLGGVFRLRLLNDFENFEPIPVNNIPGFGRTRDNTVPALNLFIKYRLGLN